MARKIILTDFEYNTLRKVLRSAKPAQVPGLDGAELRAYRDVLTKILQEDHRFPDTDGKSNE